MSKFFGSANDLMEIISTFDRGGDWQVTRKKVVYRASDGTVVNWWPTTETINFQGPHFRADAFEEKFRAAAAENHSRVTTDCTRPVPAEILLSGHSGRQSSDSRTPGLLQAPRAKSAISNARSPGVHGVKPGKWR